MVFITRLVGRVTTVGLGKNSSNRASWLRLDKDINKVSFDDIMVSSKLVLDFLFCFTIFFRFFDL